MNNEQSALDSHDRWLIFLALLIIIVTPFAADSYTPSMPAITKALSTSTDRMQLTMTLYLLGASLSQLIYGPLSDQYGRRPVILIGLIITVIGSMSCAISGSIFWLLMSRLIQGSGAGVCNALFRAVLRDSFSGPKMAQAGSYASMFYTVAYAGAPIIGGYIETYIGWRANFIFAALVMLAILLTLTAYLPETHLTLDKTATQFKNVVKNYFILLCSPVFIGYTCISSLAFSGLISYYTAAPFLLQNTVGLTAVQFGWLSLGLAMGMFVGQYLNARLVVIIGLSRMLLLGLLLMTFSGLFMMMFGLMGYLNTMVVIVPVVIFSIASGFVFANAMTEAFQSFAHIAGVAGAMYGFLQILGSSLTTILVSGLHERTQLPLASIYLGLGVSALVIYSLLSRRSQ